MLPEVTSIQAGAGRPCGGRTVPERKPVTMPIVAHSHPFVIGVDTHIRTHTLVVMVAATGELIATEQLPAANARLDRAVARAAHRTDGDLATSWVTEALPPRGARLASAVHRAGFDLVEAARMDARAQNSAGMSNPLDAQRDRQLSPVP